MTFTDKVVLVTGASSGIGAAIAIKFAEEGAKLSIVGRNESKLKDVSEKCKNAGSSPLVVVADVSKDDDAKRIIDDTLEHFGKLDILINNAGVGGQATISEENCMQVFDQVMSINLRAVVYLTHLASKHLFETKGNIINISSIASTIASTPIFSYATSKAALDHFSRSIAFEFAPKGVRVNVINPGPVKTDIIKNMGLIEENEAEIWESFKNASALKRISDPEEIADLALFLASDKAVGITGSCFVSDNGCLLGK